MKPLLFLPRLRSTNYSPRQQETIDFITAETRLPQYLGWTVEPYLISPANRFAYAKGLSAVWGRADPLLILEHDVVPPTGALRQLADCPHHVCTISYPLHMCRHRAIVDRATMTMTSFVCVQHAVPVPSYRVADPKAEGGFSFGPEPAEFADLTSLGATKFSGHAQSLLQSIPRVTWSLLDDAISRRLFAIRQESHRDDLRVHLHWPAARHNHPMPLTPHEPVLLNGGQPAPCRWIGELPPQLQATITAEMAREPPPHPFQIRPPE